MDLSVAENEVMSLQLENEVCFCFFVSWRTALPPFIRGLQRARIAFKISFSRSCNFSCKSYEKLRPSATDAAATTFSRLMTAIVRRADCRFACLSRAFLTSLVFAFLV